MPSMDTRKLELATRLAKLHKLKVQSSRTDVIQNLTKTRKIKPLDKIFPFYVGDEVMVVKGPPNEVLKTGRVVEYLNTALDANDRPELGSGVIRHLGAVLVEGVGFREVNGKVAHVPIPVTDVMLVDPITRLPTRVTPQYTRLHEDQEEVTRRARQRRIQTVQYREDLIRRKEERFQLRGLRGRWVQKGMKQSDQMGSGQKAKKLWPTVGGKRMKAFLQRMRVKYREKVEARRNPIQEMKSRTAESGADIPFSETLKFQREEAKKAQKKGKEEEKEKDKEKKDGKKDKKSNAAKPWPKDDPAKLPDSEAVDTPTEKAEEGEGQPATEQESASAALAAFSAIAKGKQRRSAKPRAVKRRALSVEEREIEELRGVMVTKLKKMPADPTDAKPEPNMTRHFKFLVYCRALEILRDRQASGKGVPSVHVPPVQPFRVPAIPRLPGKKFVMPILLKPRWKNY
eukprot:RCo000076